MIKNNGQQLIVYANEIIIKITSYIVKFYINPDCNEFLNTINLVILPSLLVKSK